MKVVLLQDVKSLGKSGDLVEVSEGYARNYILPQKLGAPATAGNLNTLKLKKANAERIAAEQLSEAKGQAEKLQKSAVTISIKGGRTGRPTVPFPRRKSRKP
jgi:large subunit ribosomal protein L9